MGYNPAIDAFNAAMDAGARRRQQDVDLEASQQRLDEARLGQSSRVSQLDSNARLGRTAAEVAEANKGANIKIAYNTATQGDLNNQGLSVDLNEKRATSDGRIGATNATNEATRLTAPLGTAQRALEQSERVATSPSRVRSTIASNTATAEEAPLGTQDKRRDVGERADTSAGRVRSTNATNANTAQDAQMKFVKEMIKLLDEGRTAEADELARRTGETVPDSIKNDAGLRRTLKQATEDAERWYPDSPRRQQQHVRTIMEETQRRGAAKSTAVSPRLDAVPGLPEAQETKLNSKAVSTPLIQNMDALKARGIAKDDKDAFRLLNQSKNDAQATIKELFKAEYKTRVDAAKGPGGYGVVSTEKLREISDEAMKAAMETTKQLRTLATEYGGQIPDVTGAAAAPAPTVPAPAPAKPAAEPTRPWFWERWFGSNQPAAPAAPGTPQPSPSGGIDGRSLQGPAPAPVKEQARVPGAEPAPAAVPMPTIEELRTRAQNFDPQAIRERARQKIANGEDRAGVLERLQQLGVDTSGL